LEVNKKRDNWWIMRIAYKILVQKPKGKTPLGRDKDMWKGNMKIDCFNCGVRM